jgi:hypothetical protein
VLKTYDGEKTASSTNVEENWISACRKLKLDPCFSPCQLSTQNGLRTLTSDPKP